MSMADFGRRGFRTDRPTSREVLERHAKSFLSGFNTAAGNWPDVHAALADIPVVERGFAYEGAAMYAAQRDLLTVGRARALARMLTGPGQYYPHLIHVGAGWALSPLRLSLVSLPATPLLRWLALDGAGFAEVFFGGRRALSARLRRQSTNPRWPVRVAGCGRALWFLACADGTEIGNTIAQAPPAARPHLWAGIGLAAAYAGAATEAELAALRELAATHRPDLVQGVVFGVTARARAGELPPHTELACAELAGLAPDTATEWAATAAAELTARPDVGAFALWRSRIRARATETA